MLSAYCKVAVAEYVANTISQCRLRTFSDWAEIKGDEFYLWNYQPNANQCGSEFIQEAVTRLLYFGEVLIVDVGGQLIISENTFTHNEYGTREDTFSNVSRYETTFNRTFLARDVIYLKYSYSGRSLECIAQDFTGAYADLIAEADSKFVSNDSIKGALNIPAMATGNPDFENKYRELMNDHFKKFFSSKNAVIPLWNGMTFSKITSEDKKTTSEIQDRESLLTAALKRQSQLYHVPATLITGETMSALVEVYNNYIDACIKPLTHALESEITRKRYGRDGFRRGCYLKFDLTDTKHSDFITNADAISKVASASAIEDNEIRERFGFRPKTRTEIDDTTTKERM
jgi:HK97 family phage portal protein